MDICQSCAMPLSKVDDFGTNNDGSKSEEYCFHCFQNGKFLDEGISLGEKIEKNVRFGVQWGCRKKQPGRWPKIFCLNLRGGRGNILN